MSAWPPLNPEGNLDRRAADVRLLTGHSALIRELVDLGSVLAEAKLAATTAAKTTNPDVSRALLLTVLGTIDQARLISDQAWHLACAAEQAHLAVVTLADVEARRKVEAGSQGSKAAS